MSWESSNSSQDRNSNQDKTGNRFLSIMSKYIDGKSVGQHPKNAHSLKVHVYLRCTNCVNSTIIIYLFTVDKKVLHTLLILHTKLIEVNQKRNNHISIQKRKYHYIYVNTEQIDEIRVAIQSWL